MVAAVGAICVATPVLAPFAGSVGSAITSLGSTAAATATATAGTASATATGAIAIASTTTVAGGATTTATAVGIALGPIGWGILGAEAASEKKEEMPTSAITYDCWKAVVGNTSTTPSQGRLIKDILSDPAVKSFQTKKIEGAADSFPRIMVENIWGQKFVIEVFMLEGRLVGHAVLIS